MSFHVDRIRQQFPYLTPVSGHVPVYLDSAATTQKPQAVIDAMNTFYRTSVGNAHRGMHGYAEAATEVYEGARETVRDFLHARYSDEIIFTRNATEGINLVAHSWARQNLKKGDQIVLSIMEHHSNIVPWLQLKEGIGVELVWIDIDEEGQLNMQQYEEALLSGRVKLVTLTAQSNVLGVRLPIREMTMKAHDACAKVLVDAAQLVAHSDGIDVIQMHCDFLVFSGHKIYGPTGIGVLYGKRELLKDIPPFMSGGMMIHDVTKEGFTPADAPARFEAGTMPVAEAAGLATAINWLALIDGRAEYEQMLIAYACDTLLQIDGLRLLGPKNPMDRHGVIAFTIDGIHAHDLTDMLGSQGFALRAGHHCAQPLHERLGVTASSRLSVGLYNTVEEMDQLSSAILEVQEKLRMAN